MTDLGSLHRRPDGRAALVFERRLKHPPEKVWRALTEPGQLAAWFPVRVLDFAPGSRLRFDLTAQARHRFGIPPDQDTVSEGEITRFEPPHLLEYEWAGEVLRWELSAHGGGCRLVFTDVFDLGDEEFNTNMSAGWAVGLELLEAHLAGEPVTWDVWERADRLTD